MQAKASTFKLEDMILLAGQPFQVAGMVQFESPDASIFTRYLLNGDKGTSQILEERASRFTVLRPFPPAAAPQASGKEVSVMGMRYALAGVDKLKVLGTQGGAVGAAPASGMLLSGRFDGETGALLREITAGAGASQTFYAVKPVAREEILTAEEYAAQIEAQRQIAEMNAAAEAESGEASGGWAAKLGGWVVAVIVVAVLVYACSGSDDEGSSGSARTGSYHYSGGSSGGK